MTPTPAIRVRFVIDHDAAFEECNGEARPLTAAEYDANAYRGCPQHPRSHVTPQRTEGGRAWCGVCGAEYADLSYAEYRAYYGNPDRHVYVGCEAEALCPCCGGWDRRTHSSVWAIDLMDDGPELRAIDLGVWLTAADAAQLPGCAGDVAREQIADVQSELDALAPSDRYSERGSALTETICAGLALLLLVLLIIGVFSLLAGIPIGGA